MTILTSYLHKIMNKQSLIQHEAEEAMTALLTDADPHQVAAFLSIMKFRGETPEEIIGMIHSLQKHAINMSFPCPVMDIVGTGGDMQNTVNISTASAILAAACEVPIAKHGNRSSSGKCGSADVMEALGINIALPKHLMNECLKQTSFAYLFAPNYHPHLKTITSVRKALKLPTVFNILGPLINPAKAQFILIGVPNSTLLELMSQTIMMQKHFKRAIIFHGQGIDELTPICAAVGYEIFDGKRTPLVIDPQRFGIAPCTIHDLRGGDATTNAEILMRAFEGEPSPVADAIVLNTAVSLWIYGRAISIEDGISISREAITNRKCLSVIKNLQSFTRKVLI